MFLRPNYRAKDGKEHIYGSLVETVRIVDGPRQRTLCCLGELNGSAQARWLKSVEVFNEQGEVEQLKLLPSQIEVPDGDPQVAKVLADGVDNAQLFSPMKALALLSTLQRRHRTPTTDGREIRLRRITEPTTEQKSLLHQLGLELPEPFQLNRKCSVDPAVA